MKSIIIIEDHSIVRAGILSLIQVSENYEVVGSFDRGQSGLEAIKLKKPDIAIIDLNLPDIPGEILIRDLVLAGLKTKILVLSREKYIPQISHLLHLGISGYVLKDTAAEELVLALDGICKDKLFISPQVKELLERVGHISFEKQYSDAKNFLTERELEIARMLCEGEESKTIAIKLHISASTVRVHTKNILEKLKLKNLKDLSKIKKDLF